MNRVYLFNESRRESVSILVVSAPIRLSAVSGAIMSALSAVSLFELFDEQPIAVNVPAMRFIVR